jgi:PAS domain S-box-containing protein
MVPGVPLDGLDVPSLWAAIEAAAEIAQLAVFLCRVDSDPPAILYASPRAAKIYGRPASTLVGQLPWAMLRESDVPVIRAAVARPPGAPPLAVSVSVVTPEGKEVPLDLSSTRIVTPRATFVFGYFRDVTAERETVAALRASEARFRFLVESAPDGVVILVRGTIVFMNPKAATLLGAGTRERALGQPIAAFLPPEDARLAGQRIAEMFRTGQEMPPNEYRTLEDPNRIVEIKSVRCDWEGQPGVLAFARDVTERKAIQQRLVDADRLAAMGTLAAGVAHEINNPLTYALLGVQRIGTMIDEVGLPADAIATIRERLSEIEHGITRVASITEGLRSFARADDAPPGPVDLAATLERALKMVENDVRHRAELVKQIDELPLVVGNASRLEQVIINVLLNALQALPAEGAHTISVTVATRDADTVVLAVRDTGRGIPDAIRGRIFDPFFTTRRIGEGMGLGLAVCKTIIEGFGGSIEVESTPGSGTTMRIVLRTYHGTAPAPGAPSRPASASARRKILIIDDERLVRDALVRLLSAEHDVIATGNGEAGLAAIAASSFDVIICDVMMPGMNGREVHRRIATDHPGLERRLVFISGGTFTPELDEFLTTTTNRCLTKPFKLDDVFVAIEATANATN